MISRDKTPIIPGYIIIRKDRKQRAGQKKTRGGGLLMGIKDTIPFKHSTKIHTLCTKLPEYKTRVEINSNRSGNFFLDQRLPQASAISPLLFFIFINDIDSEIAPTTICESVRLRHRDLEPREKQREGQASRFNARRGR